MDSHRRHGRHAGLGPGRRPRRPTSRPFAEPWEGRSFALTLLTMGRIVRAATSTRSGTRSDGCDPVAYLADGYYGRWLNAAELMLIDSAHPRARAPSTPGPASCAGEDVEEPAFPEPDRPDYAPDRRPGSLRAIDADPAFAVGDAVRDEGPATRQGTDEAARLRARRRGTVERGAARRTCCPTPTPCSRARTRSTSTRWASPPPSCGAPDAEPFTLHGRPVRELPGGQTSEPTGATAARPSPPCAPRRSSSCSSSAGLVDPAVMDKFIKNYENDVGPLNGAKVVARAWTDPEYRGRLLADGTAAIKELGFGGPQGEHIVVLEQTDDGPPRRRLHPVLLLPVAGPRAAAELVQGPGLPRARGARAARGAARDGPRGAGGQGHRGVGLQPRGALPGAARSARRAPRAGDADALAALVTRDAMVGVATVPAP